MFNSTILDYLLRNIGIEDVFVAGFLTDQCIDHDDQGRRRSRLLHDLPIAVGAQRFGVSRK